MNIQAEKIEIMKLVLDTDNPSLLQKIRNLFVKEKDFWNTLSDSEKQDIKQGLADLEKGDVYPYEEVMKKHRQ